MSSRLSVCLLARDEERNIERAIRSVGGIADELIVVDAGSTDRTSEVATGQGARVVPFDWDDDFGAGRNAALDAADGDWVLWLNPDEELVNPGDPLIRALIEPSEEPVGFMARVRHVARADRPDQYAEAWDLRLFRRRPDLRYVGRLHPILTPNGEAEGPRVAPSDLAIRRHAYLSELDEGKLRWAVRLLERELADRPGHLPYLIEYGSTLLRLNDPRGRGVMAEALGRIADVADAPNPPGSEAQVALEYVIRAPSDDAEPLPIGPEEAAALALRWFPNSPPLLWALAERYARLGRGAAAIVLLERLVQLGASGTFDRSRPFEPGIVGPRALLNLAECCRALGRPEDAARHARLLLGDPDVGNRASAILDEVTGGAGQGGP